MRTIELAGSTGILHRGINRKGQTILAERGIPQDQIQKANKTEEVLVFPSVIVPVQGIAELGSLSHLSTVEQLQARADYFFYGIHRKGKNLVGHNLIGLLG